MAITYSDLFQFVSVLLDMVIVFLTIYYNSNKKK